jgi:hypothetical protein
VEKNWWYFKALAFRGIKNISVGKEALACLDAQTNTHHHTDTGFCALVGEVMPPQLYHPSNRWFS